MKWVLKTTPVRCDHVQWVQQHIWAWFHYGTEAASTPQSFLFESNCTTKGIWLVSHWQRGLPWWSRDWESACQWRGHGLDPWSRRIPHAAESNLACTELLSPHTLEPGLCNKRSHCNEKTTYRNWRVAPQPVETRENPCTAMRIHCR